MFLWNDWKLATSGHHYHNSHLGKYSINKRLRIFTMSGQMRPLMHNSQNLPEKQRMLGQNLCITFPNRRKKKHDFFFCIWRTLIIVASCLLVTPVYQNCVFCSSHDKSNTFFIWTFCISNQKRCIDNDSFKIPLLKWNSAMWHKGPLLFMTSDLYFTPVSSSV